MPKKPGRNKHQKAAHKVGEVRVGREEIEELLKLSRSDDPREREVAASYLCPCYVRRRMDNVWQALYRMMEDADVRVRRAAWHTLEDGGRPDDPALDAVLQRVLQHETDATVRRFAESLTAPRRQQEMMDLQIAGWREIKPRGKCDFCGATNVPVERDLETMIPTSNFPRPALICEECAKA